MNSIVTRRKACGMTIAELAMKVGVTSGFICQVEQGKSSFSIHTAAKLAKALGCTVDELIQEEQDDSADAQREGSSDRPTR